ncbi:MAG: class I SAM-dependent methyltransferase [Acidimicrobiia bacterium]
MTGYSFGDSELAAERLHVLDTVFAPTTDALLDGIDITPARVADLGCGPGATTARLVDRFPGATVTGMDASGGFLAAARDAVPAATFVGADVTRPLPGTPYDLVYARFLLAHLPDVGAAIRNWLDALAPGGWLVLEETEHIASRDPWFARYEAVSVARVAAAGAQVYAGADITAAIPSGAEILVDRVIGLDVGAGDAAGMFWRNLATWGRDAVDQGLILEPDRAELLAHLRDRADDPTRGLFTWTHHQTVLRRA